MIIVTVLPAKKEAVSAAAIEQPNRIASRATGIRMVSNSATSVLVLDVLAADHGRDEIKRRLRGSGHFPHPDFDLLIRHRREVVSELLAALDEVRIGDYARIGFSIRAH